MRYRHRAGWQSGSVHLATRRKAEIEDGEFEVPPRLSDDPAVHQRLINAGNVPLDPSALPEGVTYDPVGSEESESGRSSDPEDDPTEDSSGEDAGEEAASESGEDGDEDEPDLNLTEADLDGMDRSQLYSVGSEQLDLDWSWSDAGSADEMRAELKELIS